MLLRMKKTFKNDICIKYNYVIKYYNYNNTKHCNKKSLNRK